jgi:hypothetical protein
MKQVLKQVVLHSSSYCPSRSQAVPVPVKTLGSSFHSTATLRTACAGNGGVDGSMVGESLRSKKPSNEEAK